MSTQIRMKVEGGKESDFPDFTFSFGTQYV